MSISSVNNNPVPPKAGGVQGPKSSETAKTDKTKSTAAAAYAKNATPASGSKEAAANVKISQRAREIETAKQAVIDTPDIREDKVAKFKDLIAKGEYKPDAGKIADGIAREALKDELAKDPSFILS